MAPTPKVTLEKKKTTPTAKKTVRRVVKPKAEKSNGTFAVFATGGKQYRVSVGDKVKIEKIKGDLKEGDKLVFDKVLLVDDGKDDITIGTPFIKGAAVNATLKKISRYKTVDVIKYKQKSRYFKKYGHRQPYFEIKIDSIK